MSRARKGAPSSVFIPMMLVVTLATGAGVYWGVPLGVIAWVGMVATAFMEPPMIYTGPRGRDGLPTPLPGEEARARVFNLCLRLRFALFFPPLPGLKVRLSWLFAIGAGCATTWQTYHPQLYVWLPVDRWHVKVASGVLMWIVVAKAIDTWRITTPSPIPKPPITLWDAIKGPVYVHPLALAFGLFAAGGLYVYANTSVLTVVGVGFMTSVATYGFATFSRVLGPWKKLCALHTEWRTRWETLLKNETPGIVDATEVGPFEVFTFSAPPGMAASEMMSWSSKLEALMGGACHVTLLPCFALDASGKEIRTLPHPSQFRVVTRPQGLSVEVCDPLVDVQIATLGIEVAFAKAVDSFSNGAPRYLIASIDNAAGEGSSTACWYVQVAGPEFTYLKDHYQPYIAIADGSVVVDDRYLQAAVVTRMDGLVINPESMLAKDISRINAYRDKDPLEMVHNAIEEDEWKTRWGAIKSIGSVNPPSPQFPFRQVERLAGATITSMPFMGRQGVPPERFAKIEPELKTTLGSAPFVSVVGYMPNGERHPQAIVVRWSNSALPSSPVALSGGRGEAASWVLAGIINKAFDDAKLPRPELLEAICLTSRSRSGNLWRCKVRLYDGVTLEDVRLRSAKLGASMAVPWMRAGEDGDDPSNIVLMCGGHYRGVSIVNPAHMEECARLEWAFAWRDAGVKGVGGQLPDIQSQGVLEDNTDVEELFFTIPAGKSLRDAKMASDKLKSATGNAFVSIEASEDPTVMRVLACKDDPMPTFAGVNYDLIESLDSTFPFSTGVEGSAIAWDPLLDPHILVAGTTGGGKSNFVQVFSYPMFLHGWQVVVIDPMKRGGDFRMYTPWLSGLATTMVEGRAMIEAVYAEVQRRIDLYVLHGGVSIDDIPEDERPPRMLVVIDEFNGVIGLSKPDPPVDSSPEAAMAFALKQADFAASRAIGDYAGRIVTQARSAGVHLMLAAQRLTAKTLEHVKGGEALRTNMARVLLGKATYGEKASVLREPDNAPDMGEMVPRGRGIFESVVNPVCLIQTWFDADSSVEFPKRLEKVRGEPVLLDYMVHMPTSEVTYEGQEVEGEVDLGVLDFDFELPGEQVPIVEEEVPVAPPIVEVVEAVSQQLQWYEQDPFA